MALKGKIDDFGIADIFQLIGQQQRSGILTVRSSNGIAEVIFVNGMISRVNPIYLSPKRDPLGDCMVKARLITEEDFQKALKKQEETLKSLEETLLDLRIVQKEQIKNVHDNLIFETLYDILQWKTGDYEFNIKEVDHDERFGNLMSIEHILLDVFRMIDEEPDLSRRIPSYDIVFQRTPLSETESKNLDIEEELGAYEQIVFNLVDGTNTVKDIIDQSLLGKYNTTKSIVSLLDAGYIRKISVGRVAPPKTFPQKTLFMHIFYGIVPIILVLLFLGLRLVVKPPPPPGELAPFSPKNAIAKCQLLKIKNALNIYFLEKGSFPESLKELVEARLIRAQELKFPPGVKYKYYLQDDGSFRLE